MQVYNTAPPAVSVVLSAFNRKKLISAAIESVLNQTIKNWELIIVDDGSSDDTFSAVNSCIREYENIRYLRHRNRGLPLSRNAGIMASAGKFVTFIDSDDVYKPEHLELRLDFMTGNPELDLIYGGLIISGSPWVADRFDNSRLIHLDQCVVGATFFGKRSVFELLDGFKNISYSEDYEFFQRAAKQFKVKKVDFQTYIYNTGSPDGICAQRLHS